VVAWRSCRAYSSGSTPARSELCRCCSVKRRTMDARLRPIAIYPSSWYSLCRRGIPCAKFLSTVVYIDTVYSQRTSSLFRRWFRPGVSLVRSVVQGLNHHVFPGRLTTSAASRWTGKEKPTCRFGRRPVLPSCLYGCFPGFGPGLGFSCPMRVPLRQSKAVRRRPAMPGRG
jgi:hypothetical protein